MKPTIVGEQNPYGGDDTFALYPAPDGCSGHRLCCLILGMTRHDYLDSFERMNLVQGKWSMKAAKVKAEAMWSQSCGKWILLGSKVCAAFQVPFVPFEISEGGTMLVLPHPSGLCRLWHEPNAFQNARDAVVKFHPELSTLIGKAKS